jgi:hypothetical protein
MRDLIMISWELLARYIGLPLRVALHLPTLRTRNTACGSHHSSKTSSGLKTGAFELDAGGAKASVRMEELMRTLAEVGASVSFAFGLRWKEYGNGSSSCRSANIFGMQLKATHLSFQLVHKHLQGISSRVRRQVDGRSKVGSIFSILELDDDGRHGCSRWWSGIGVDLPGVSRSLSFRGRE